MKKIALAIVAVIALSGCGSAVESSDETRIQGTEDVGRLNSTVVTIRYDGKDLDCITWSGSHSEVGMTCDFVKYHAEQDGDFE